MSTLARRLETGANVAIIAVSVLLAAVLLQRQFFAGRSGTDVAPPLQPLQVSSLDMDWKASRLTMLVVVREGCHFCTESAPFYRRLSAETRNTRVRVVFLLQPQETQDTKYLDTLVAPTVERQHADFGRMNIRGTPTLILVDQKGAVVRAWEGKLTASEEKEVLTLIG